MKVLVIPDVHCRTFWRKTIDKYIGQVEKVIFLGDYVDPYSSEKNLEDNYIEMLKNIISLKKNEPDKYVLLLGNHVDHYIWKDFPQSTRYDIFRAKDYNNIFKDNLNLFNLVWIEDNVIFSHAGISEGWADDFIYSSMKYDENAELEKNSVVFETAEVLKYTSLEDFNEYYIDSISHVSRYRGGRFNYGSCEWADLQEHINIEKSTIDNIVPKGQDGIYQIFGHTQLRNKPIITDKWACLDCRRGFIVDTLTYEITEL